MAASSNGGTAQPHVAIMRSALGQARGLGAGKAGTATWWAERLTAVALVPLTLWFVLAIFHLEDASRDSVARWAGRPLNATLLVALVLTTFRHMSLGLQAVIEDYIPGKKARIIWLLGMKAVVALLGLTALVSVLKLAFSG